jgi:hypothetical protein
MLRLRHPSAHPSALLAAQADFIHHCVHSGEVESGSREDNDVSLMRT